MFQNWNYNLQKRLSNVLPNQQSHQVLYRTTCCEGCGTPLYFHHSVMWLSHWRYGEALRRDFLYTTKSESKFILRPNGIPPPISSLKPVFQRQGAVSGVTLKSDLYVFLACSV